jgi:hypothetical protein
MRRRNVRAFIDADPVSIVLTREAAPTQTAAGGFVASAPADPLPAQRARIVQNKRRFNNGIVNAEAGDIPDTDYLLLGNYSFNGEVNDIFFWQDRKYTITGIHELRTESFLASIDLAGPVNRHGQ